MGSLVPPPSSDHFTAELCLFLSSLATTTGTQFDSLTDQLVKLREALLEEVVRETAESDSEDDTLEETTDTVEETLSDISTEGTTEEEEEKSDFSVREITRPLTGGYESRSNNHRVMISLQRGARYELEERLVRQAFSEFGKVVKIKLFDAPFSGSWGFLEFRTTHSAAEALNQVVRAGNCWLHTSLPKYCLTQLPVPHQILLESRYLPQVWEKEIVLRSFFSKYGVVTGVSLLGFKQQMMQRFIISFKDPSVAQELIGTTVKILTCTVVVKEVSSSTVGGESGGRRGRREGEDRVSGGGDRNL